MVDGDVSSRRSDGHLRRAECDREGGCGRTGEWGDDEAGDEDAVRSGPGTSGGRCGAKESGRALPIRQLGTSRTLLRACFLGGGVCDRSCPATGSEIGAWQT